MTILAESSLLFLLAGVIIQLILGRVLKPKAKGWLAFICSLGSLLSILLLAPTIIAGQSINSSVGIPLHLDGLSLVFALMASGIGSAILLYSIDYMAHEQGTTRFYALMLTFIAGLLGLVMSVNLLAVYFCWEMIGLCSYFLVGFWYKETAATNGARKVLVMTHIPGYALLIGILLLYRSSGTLLWTDPSIAASFTTGIFLLMLLAAMAKSVIFPLNTWIPEAMNAPTPVSALLHSACYVKAGVYLVARIYSMTPWRPEWHTIVIALGCITMLIGALFALVQTDLKRLLAYSTISQIGYIITALGIGTPLGAAAGIFYVFSHGLFKGTLFMCAGAVQHAAGTRDMRQLGGLAARMPVTARIWLIAGSAIVGVPLTNGFIAKWLLYDAALEANTWIVVIIAWLVSIFTAFYILKATVSVFYGKMPDALSKIDLKEAPLNMQLGMGFLAGLCLFLGVAPQLLLGWVAAPAVSAMNFSWGLNMTFLGIHTLSASVPTTLGAVLVLAALLIAVIVFLPFRPKTGSTPIFTGGDPLPESNTLNAEDFSDFAQTTFQPVLDITNPDPVFFWLWRAIQAISAWVNRTAVVLENHPYMSAAIAAILIAMIVWVF